MAQSSSCGSKATLKKLDPLAYDSSSSKRCRSISKLPLVSMAIKLASRTELSWAKCLKI